MFQHATAKGKRFQICFDSVWRFALTCNGNWTQWNSFQAWALSSTETSLIDEIGGARVGTTGGDGGGTTGGAVVRALASHQCGLGSIPGPSVICELSLLLVLSLLREVFVRVHISRFQFDPEYEDHRFVSRKTVRCYPR